MTDCDKGEASMPFPVRRISRPDPLSDATVEAVARAYCKRIGLDPDEMIDDDISEDDGPKSPLWRMWKYNAREAIAMHLAVQEVLG
jgi:hypothetical protein